MLNVISTNSIIDTAEQKEYEIVGKRIVCHQLEIQKLHYFNWAAGICKGKRIRRNMNGLCGPRGVFIYLV